jgi:hypothetical protein
VLLTGEQPVRTEKGFHVLFITRGPQLAVVKSF